MTDPMLNNQEPNEAEGLEVQEPVAEEAEGLEVQEPVADEALVEKKKEPFVAAMLEYLEILVLSVCAVLIIFTFGIRLCRVDGSSMYRTLSHNEMLLTASLSEVEAGDIIVFHQTSDIYTRFNEPLVKRVIATEGQVVKIDYFEGKVYVDGVLLDEPYMSLLNASSTAEIPYWTVAPAYDFDRSTGVFETTVPEGCLFVMGDNRNNSADSRSLEVGFVDERRVLGKVICRLSPYTKFE